MLRKIGISLSVLLATMMPIFIATPALAEEVNIEKHLCAGVNLDVKTDCSTKVDGQTATERINKMIATIINIFSLVVGVVAVIMIIVGGFKYITSGGDSTNVSGAKNTILYAIIGLIIVALSQWIVRFVLTRTA